MYAAMFTVVTPKCKLQRDNQIYNNKWFCSCSMKPSTSSVLCKPYFLLYLTAHHYHARYWLTVM